MRILFPAAATLAACSAPSAPEPAATPSPEANAVVATTPSAPPPAPSQAAPVRPGELKTFGDWTVACDNTALCTMTSLGPENGVPGDPVMTLLRQPGREGAVDLAFDAPGDGAPVSPVAVAIDSRRLALPALNGPAAARVAAALAEGQSLTILESGYRPRARLSLRGASAALRYIDDRQGRAGGVTAIVARGDRPAAAVPERIAAPVINAVVPTGAPAALTPAQLAAMRARAACKDERMTGGDEFLQPKAHALGGGATLVLLPCSAGAYNLFSSVFVLRGDQAEPARLDAPTGFGVDEKPDAVPSVVNGEWRDGELSTFAKGRGLGDCGVRQAFVWDGDRLRLSEQSEMGECRGNPNYITTWRAQVVRR